MGLDGVEIVMAVEDAFDIRIEDADAEKALTPRDLIEIVLSKVQKSDSSACLTHRSFNLLRATLMHGLSLKRADISPSLRLDCLVAIPARRSFCSDLAADLKTGPLPSLERPWWLVVLLMVMSTAAGVGVAVALTSHIPVPLSAVLAAGGLSAACIGYLAALGTRGLRQNFPQLISTVGDLSRWILAHKKDLADAKSGGWTRPQVAERIKEIVIAQLGCEGIYREDALFVDELGVA